LSTLVSNERGQRPLIRDSAADREFSLGDSAYASGDYAGAKRHFFQAKEWDGLRFRAPDTMNKVIVGLTRKYFGVHLVDAKGLFEQYSPHGIVGGETLLEHVHPNLFGYALLSEGFYRAMQNAGVMGEAGTGGMSFAELLQKMPVTAVDSLNGAYTIMMLKTRWPFNEPIPPGFKRGNSVSEQLAGAIAVKRITWMDAMNELYQISVRTKDKAMALKAVGAVMLENPSSSLYKLYAGRLSFELGDDREAIFYFKQAYALDPSMANTQTLYLAYLKMDQPEKALAYIDTALAMQPANQELPSLKSLAGQIIQLKRRLAVTPGDDAISRVIALDYHHVGADEAAEKYVNSPLGAGRGDGK
jgi:tetratricopeptide (TPR) repeat protein